MAPKFNHLILHHGSLSLLWGVSESSGDERGAYTRKKMKNAIAEVCVGGKAMTLPGRKSLFPSRSTEEEPEKAT